MSDVGELGFKVDTKGLKKGEKALDDFAKKGEQTEKRVNTSNKNIKKGFNGVEKATTNTAEAQKKAEKTMANFSRTAEKAGQVMAAFSLAAAAAISVIVKKSGDAAFEISKLARVSSSTVEGFQKMSFAAKAYGIEQDKLADILKDTQDKVGDFMTTGGGAMIDFFEKIAPKVGVTTENFKNLNGKDALQLYVSSLEKANVNQSEMVFYMEAIASDSILLQPLLANNGSEFERLAGKAEDLGLILNDIDITNLKEMNIALGVSSSVSSAFSNIIGSTLAPFVTDLANKFNETTISVNKTKESVHDLLSVGTRVFGVFADAYRVIEIFGTSLAVAAFTAKESFSTMTAELKNISVAFDLTFAELHLSLVKWVNKQDAAISQWAENMINATDVFNLFDDIEIKASPINTDELEDSIVKLKKEKTNLESTLSTSSEKIKTAWSDLNQLLLKPLPSEGMAKWIKSIIKAKEELQKLQKETKTPIEDPIEGTSLSFDKTIAALQNQSIQLSISADDYEIYMARVKAANDGITDSAEVRKIIEALELIQTKRKEIADEKAAIVDFDKLSKGIENFGGAWSKSGSVIVDAFGDISDAMGDYMSQLSKIEKNEKSLAKFRETKGKDNVEVIALQNKLNSDRVNAELSGMKSLSAAGASLFAEKTTAAKTFAALNKMITVAEIALSFQKMTVGTTEAGVHVANETVKQGANSLTAITAAFAAPWPIGFVAGAAMIGIMASLLGGSSGGGGSAKDEPKSSVLGGGDPSESTSKAANKLEEIQVAQLAELKGLRSDMAKTITGSDSLIKHTITMQDKIELDLSGSIESAFASLNFDDTTTTESSNDIFNGRFDDLFGFKRQIKSIFTDLDNTIAGSLDVLGVEAAANIKDFVFDVGVIDFGDLTGSEIQEELNRIISTQSDLLTQSLAPAMQKYQLVGEGLFETLIRITKEQVVFNDAIDIMGLSLAGLSKTIEIDTAQAIISLMGGLDNFSDLTSSFVDDFFSDAEQFEILENSLTDIFTSINLPLSKTKEEFKNLVSSVDITTKSGQELIATLLEINPSLAEYLDHLEDIERTRVGMTISLLELQGEAEKALNMEREIELNATDKSLISLQKLIYAEEDQISLINEQVKALKHLEDTAKSSFKMLDKAINLDKQRAQAALDIARTAHNSELSRITELRSILDAKNTGVSSLADAQTALNKSFDNKTKLIQDNASKEIASIQSNSAARIDALNEEKSALTSTASSMESLISSINSSINSTSNNNLSAALMSAKRGNFEQAKALDISSLVSLDASKFSSSADLKIQQAVNQNRLKELSSLAGEQLTEAEAQIAAIENSVLSAKINSDSQVLTIQKNADKQAINLQEQLDKLLGIDNSTVSINEAIAQFTKAFDYNAEIEKLDLLIKSAEDVFDLHEQAYDKEIDRLDSILESNEMLLNTALGIDVGIMSVTDAIRGLNTSISAMTLQQTTIHQYGGFKPSTSATASDNKAKQEDHEILSLLKSLNRSSGKTANSLQNIEFGQPIKTEGVQ